MLVKYCIGTNSAAKTTFSPETCAVMQQSPTFPAQQVGGDGVVEVVAVGKRDGFTCTRVTLSHISFGLLPSSRPELGIGDPLL